MKKLILLLITALMFPAYAQKVQKQDAKGQEETKTHTIVSDKVSEAQTTIDSVNISQMVLGQIEAARQKALQEQNKPVVKVESKKIEKPVEVKTNYFAEIRKNIPLSDGDLMKVSIIVVFSFMVFGMVFLRRLKNRVARKGKGKKGPGMLKKNISMLREEKPLKIKYTKKLKSIRTKLKNQKSTLNLTNETVTKTARELQISKGEVLLASRIKAHEVLSKGSQKKLRVL